MPYPTQNYIKKFVKLSIDVDAYGATSVYWQSVQVYLQDIYFIDKQLSHLGI